MKTVRLPVSPEIAELASILTSAHGLEVKSSFSGFTERIIELLEEKYPVIGKAILADCVETTQRECARVALLEGTRKLREYEDHDAPQTALGPVSDTRDRIVKAILAGAESGQ